MVYTRSIYWAVTLYDPNDLEKEGEMGKLIDDEKYPTLKKVCEAVNDALQDREISIKYHTVAKIGCDKYRCKDKSRIKKILMIKKMRGNVDVSYVEYGKNEICKIF